MGDRPDSISQPVWMYLSGLASVIKTNVAAPNFRGNLSPPSDPPVAQMQQRRENVE
jgi:hypothetical protein